MIGLSATADFSAAYLQSTQRQRPPRRKVGSGRMLSCLPANNSEAALTSLRSLVKACSGIVILLWGGRCPRMTARCRTCRWRTSSTASWKSSPCSPAPALATSRRVLLPGLQGGCSPAAPVLQLHERGPAQEIPALRACAAAASPHLRCRRGLRACVWTEVGSGAVPDVRTAGPSRATRRRSRMTWQR